jgi:hypothetical protein
MKDLALDILTWDKFYLSGRMHKLVRDILSFVFLHANEWAMIPCIASNLQ